MIKQWTKEDYKLYLSKRSESYQDFLYHVISKFGKKDEYTEEQFVKEYHELPRGLGKRNRRSPRYAKNEWRILKEHGY